MDIANLENLYTKSANIREMIRNCQLPSELEALLYQQFDALAATRPNLLVAVRSSALGEDLGQASLAGLYHTELQIDRAHLIEAYKAVLASKYSPPAISYRLAKGYRHEETEMCVGCLAMIDAVCSGICYSRSIGGGVDTLDIFFAGGSAKGIVDDTRSTHPFLLERTPPHRLVQRALLQEPQGELLTDAQTVALAAMAMDLENLINPAAPEFQAANCRTMHDIARFCHERSVIEMFDFGARYHFDRGVAKRMLDSMPLEWWVFNLDDGFNPDFALERPEIAITDIVSNPMLALWEGMHAVAWEPPPRPAGHHGLFSAAIGDAHRS
jgi:hypothetical protein